MKKFKKFFVGSLIALILFPLACTQGGVTEEAVFEKEITLQEGLAKYYQSIAPYTQVSEEDLTALYHQMVGPELPETMTNELLAFFLATDGLLSQLHDSIVAHNFWVVVLFAMDKYQGKVPVVEPVQEKDGQLQEEKLQLAEAFEPPVVEMIPDDDSQEDLKLEAAKVYQLIELVPDEEDKDNDGIIQEKPDQLIGGKIPGVHDVLSLFKLHQAHLGLVQGRLMGHLKILGLTEVSIPQGDEVAADMGDLQGIFSGEAQQWLKLLLNAASLKIHGQLLSFFQIVDGPLEKGMESIGSFQVLKLHDNALGVAAMELPMPEGGEIELAPASGPKFDLGKIDPSVLVQLIQD